MVVEGVTRDVDGLLQVVDLRDRSGADGKIQQRQRKQLEVYRSQVPGGSLQVIRTHTVATSSSKWSTSRDGSDKSDFENLHVSVLDVW